MDEPLPQLRIGDRERHEVDHRLQAAVGDGLLTLGEYDERSGLLWAARTRNELDVLVADLPAPRAASPAPLATEIGQRPRRVLAVMSGDELSPALRPGQAVHAYAVMGQAQLDLRRADLPREVHVRAVALMGEVQVLVPRGASVQLSGLSLMGSREVHVDAAGADGPVVHVDAQAVMGSVRVAHGSEPPAVGRDVEAHRHAGRSGSGALQRRHTRRWLRPLVGGAIAVGLLSGAASVLRHEDRTVVFGSSTLSLSGDEGRVDVGTVFGSITVTVPDGVRVRESGVVVFGSVDCADVCQGAAGRVVEVHSSGGFGSVEIRREGAAQDSG